MEAACRTEGCTVGDTGICLLNNNPDECEHRILVNEPSSAADTQISGATLGEPVLDQVEDKPTLWGSLPLQIDEVRDLMARRRCILIGVVGTPAAGKTAALVSMYLLLSHGKLAGYSFADSRSLMAMEEISQGARRWGASPPDEMTSRTETGGGRVAGFLHVTLRRERDGALVDLVIPDLPGEWSDALIDTNRTERLDFLRAADVIWVFVNGSDLRTADSRMHTLSRASLLFRRIATFLDAQKPQFKLVISHADRGALPDATRAKLLQKAVEAGVDVEIIDIASFSNSGDVAPGAGISELIDRSMPVRSAFAPKWPNVMTDSPRFMHRFERSGS